MEDAAIFQRFTELGSALTGNERKAVSRMDEQKPKSMIEIIKEAGYVMVVRCKDCKHRPYDEQKGKGFLLTFPDDTCPCQNQNDNYYSWYPPDDWFCPDGERRVK